MVGNHYFHPFINSRFNWTIPNLYLGNVFLTKHSLNNWLFRVPGLSWRQKITETECFFWLGISGNRITGNLDGILNRPTKGGTLFGLQMKGRISLKRVEENNLRKLHVDSFFIFTILEYSAVTFRLHHLGFFFPTSKSPPSIRNPAPLRHIPPKHCRLAERGGFSAGFSCGLRVAEKKHRYTKGADVFLSNVASFMIQMSVVSFEDSLGMTPTCTYLAPDIMKIFHIRRPTNIWPATRYQSHLPQILTKLQFRFLTLISSLNSWSFVKWKLVNLVRVPQWKTAMESLLSKQKPNLGSFWVEQKFNFGIEVQL